MKEDIKEDITEDIKKYQSLEAVGKSEGGKILLSDMKSDIIATVDQLAVGYKELTHIELISLCAGLSEKLTMIRTLKNAKARKEMVMEILEEY